MKRLGGWLALVALAAAALAVLAILTGRGDGAADAVENAAGRAWAALVGAVGEDDDDRDEDDDDDRGRGEDDDDDEPPLPLVDGVLAVRLDESRQKLAGIATERLETASLTPTLRATAEVVDVQPLAALRGLYRERFYGARAADIAVAAARREHERLDALYRDDADIARKEVMRAEAAWQTARAERYRVWAGLDSLRARARSEWGAALADQAFADDDARFARLVDSADSLLRAVLPAGRILPGGVREASLERNGAAVPAAYVSPAPRTVAGGGESHFFLVSGLPLPAGLRLDLRIPLAEAPAVGLALPPEAVVRALGRDWAYARIDDSHFVRREVALGRLLPDGRYLAGGLEPDAEVATVGAMVLYAEEFRSQVRNEDDDD